MGVCHSQRSIPEDERNGPRPLKKSSQRQATSRSPAPPNSTLSVTVHSNDDLESVQNPNAPMTPDMDQSVRWDPTMEDDLSQRSDQTWKNRLSIRGTLYNLHVGPAASESPQDVDFGRNRMNTSSVSRQSTFARAGRRGTLAILQSVSTLLTHDELLMDVDQQVDCVENLNDLLESQKILTRLQSCGDYMKRTIPSKRRSVLGRRKSILTAEKRKQIQDELQPGERLTDVKEVFPKDIKHSEAINYWREFEHIRFYKSPTVTKVIGQILQTEIPEIGVSYQTIIDEFLHQDWPINIFLHGGLMRDIMTSTIGNDVDIAFTCPHREMHRICEEKNWQSTIREDIPYWVIGGESNFETKLEGFSLSFNGLSKFHIVDFACNTIYYDCKNNILIDRYGRGVKAALDKKLTLPVYDWEDRYKWRDTDFIPGVKMYRFFKFVTRGFDYDPEAAKFIQCSLVEYVELDPVGAEHACFHALRHLARGQDDKRAALKYKKKLQKAVKDLFLAVAEGDSPTEKEAQDYWEHTWESTVNQVINQGTFTERDVDRANEAWDSAADVMEGVEESDYGEHFGKGVGGGDSVVDLGTGKSLSGIE